VFLLWLAGVLAFLAVLVQRIRFVKGLVSASCPAGDELTDLLEQCRRQMAVRRDIKLRLSEAFPSPAVCGLLRPTVLMPTSLIDKLSPEGLRATLIHELAHIKRGDLWVNSVQTFLQVVYFYNPFVWFANSMIRKVCEEAVDETVLVALGGQAKDYSNTLIDIGEMVFWKADLGLRLIGVAESKKALQWRIKHMLNRPIPKSSKLGALGIIMLLVIAAVLLPMARAEKAAEATKPVIAENEEEPARSLHQAVMYGDVEQVKALIADGAHVNAKDKLGATPLHRAAERGSAVIVELLIAKGADVNVKCRLDRTPLHQAASKGHKDVVQILLDSDAKINTKSGMGMTPLHTAILCGHTEVARMLIRRGADVNTRAEGDIATPMDSAVFKGLHDMVELLIDSGADIPFPDIHFAAFQGDVSKVKDLIQRGANVDEEDRRGKTPLFFAVWGGQGETVEFLLSNAADVDANNVDGRTPLHYTASSGNLKMTGLLLAKGANIDVRDKWGGTPLHGAAKDGRKETASLLIKKGADVNAKNKEGRTPLHEAIEYYGKEVKALLIAAGADVNAEDENGYTPLYLATIERDEDIIDLLKSKGATLTATIHLAAVTGDFAGVKRYIEEGTDINKGDKSGWTPLLLAVFCGQEGGQEEVVEFLLANGADVNASRNNGWTPLHMACQIGRKDMVELLIAAGADVNAKSDGGRTPTDCAKRFKYSEIIDLLRKHGAKE
jgi:ankyrin repeat protein